MKIRKIGVILAVTAFWLSVWQLLSLWIGQELLLPSPIQVLAALFRLGTTAAFWKAAGFSLLRVTAGYLIAVIVGCALAALTVRFWVAEQLFSPLLKITRSAPVASFIILTLIFIKADLLPAFIAFLMVLPLIWSNVEKGIRQTDPQLLEMAQAYRLGKQKIFWHIRVPSVMPYLLSAATTGLGFAWKSGIAAEIICLPVLSLGRQLYFSKVYLETADVFAWTSVAILLSVILEKLLLWLMRRLNQRLGIRQQGGVPS